jgi:hypothetical protein
MMKLDKADLGLVLPKEFYQHYQQDKHQEERCSYHNRNAEFGALSEYKYEISLSSIHAIQKTPSQHMTSNFSISLQFLLLRPLHQQVHMALPKGKCLDLPARGNRRYSGQHRFRWLDKGLGNVAPLEDAASNIRLIGSNEKDG